MIRLTAVLVVLLFVAPVATAYPNDAPDPVLVALRLKLERELRDLKPAPTFEIPSGHAGKQMIMCYKTREYQIHQEIGYGRLSEKPITKVGPDSDGVMLSVFVQPNGEVNQAALPQTVKEPYWAAFLDVYPVADKSKQIFCGVAFRPTTDKKLVERIKQVLAIKE